MSVSITLIAAVSEGNIIGHNGGIPWRLTEDLKHFKAYTNNKTVVMGRKTWFSLPMRPLLYRHNLVLTSGKINDVSCVSSVQDAIDHTIGQELVVIGGQQAYEAFLPIANKIVLTYVHKQYEGDTVFPTLDSSWNKIEVGPTLISKGNIPYSISTIERV